MPSSQEKRRVQKATRRQRHKLELYARLGARCACGFADQRALQVDHLRGGGSRIKKEKLPGWSNNRDYGSLLKLSDDELKKRYQLLCANCNWVKRYTNNEVYLVRDHDGALLGLA